MKIKVLHLTSSPYKIGGAEKLLLDMADYYDRSRFSVSYCNLFDAPSNSSFFTRALADRKLPHLKIPGYRWFEVPQIIYRLSRHITEQKIDIVHSHLIHSTIIGAVLSKVQRSHKSVFTRHYTESALRKSALMKLDRKAFRLADSVVAVSTSVKNDLLNIGVDENRIKIIPNGIDITAFDNETLRPSNLSDILGKNKFVICSVGNLNYNKDHITLIKAMSEVVKKYSLAVLIIVGEGSERPRLEKLITDKNLEKHIVLTGFRNNVPAILKESNLYVHSSKTEAFGISILEAMAAEIPVISTAVDGVLDIIENNQDGFFVAPHDPSEMAGCICRVIENPQESVAIAERGREKVEKYYRIEEVVKAYQNLYEDII